MPTDLPVPLDKRTQRLGRRLTDRSSDPVRNSTIVFVLITLVLFGVVAMQTVALRDFRQIVYDRCVDLKPGSDSAAEFRKAQVKAFELFTQDPSIPASRKQLYIDLVEQGREAVAKYSSPNCEIYR